MKTQEQLLKISSVNLDANNHGINYYIIDVDDDGLVGYWVHTGCASWIAKSNLRQGHLFMGGMFGWYGVKGYMDLVRNMTYEMAGVVPVVDLSSEAKALLEREKLEERQ